MIRISDVYDFINAIAPFSLQEDYDNSGLAIGNMEVEVKKILVALDCTVDVAKEAAEKNYQLIVTHHPVIFHALKQIDTQSLVGTLVRSNIAVLSAHTNFDSAKGGLNDVLCDALGMKPVKNLAVDNDVEIGYICNIEEISPENLAEKIKSALGNKVVRYSDCGKNIKKVAVISGSGGGYINDAIKNNCDAIITGDIKHDVFVDAYNMGLQVFDAGHFYTENIFCEDMKNRLLQKFADIDVKVAQSNRDITKYTI